MDDFLTIHELSTHFDVSARVIRYNFQKLREAGKLLADLDYKQINYRDATHFEWLIALTPFMRESGLARSPVVTQVFPTAPVSKPVSPSLPFVTKPDNHLSAPVNQVGNASENVATQPLPTATKPANQLDTKDTKPHETTPLEREMIDLLKGELTIKNGQIAELSEQNAKLNDLNKNLVGQSVQLSERIQKLMQLPAGDNKPSSRTIKVDEALVSTGNKVVSDASSVGEQMGSEFDTKVGDAVAPADQTQPDNEIQGEALAA